MKLPRHIGYFRKLFVEKYGVLPEKIRIQRSKETGFDYTIFLVPASVKLDDEDKSLVLAEYEDYIELAVRNYNFRNALPDRFDADGVLVGSMIRQVSGLNKKYLEAFIQSFEEIFNEVPQRLAIWRNMETRETYAFFGLPVSMTPELLRKYPSDTITEAGVPYEGYLVRYRQMDKVPMSFFTEEGIKLNRKTAKDYGLTYEDLRTDTDDYRRDRTPVEALEAKLRDAENARRAYSELTPEEREEKRIRNREYFRKKSGYYERRGGHLPGAEQRPMAELQSETYHPIEEMPKPETNRASVEHPNPAAEGPKYESVNEARAAMHKDRDIDLLRERELEMKDPLTDEEFAELQQVRIRLYGEEK